MPSLVIMSLGVAQPSIGGNSYVVYVVVVRECRSAPVLIDNTPFISTPKTPYDVV